MRASINWYGRCCFLVELNGKKILFDPYDRYCNVDIGLINSDILISSSTWHDHGHIGASPNSMLFTYPGAYDYQGFKIYGIEAKENRGTPTIVFTVQYEDLFITNFADLGAKEDDTLSRNLLPEQSELLNKTTIAFARPSIEGENITSHNVHDEKFLNYCQPKIIIPEHYFPESFILEQVPAELKADFFQPNIIIDEMIQNSDYPIREVDDYKIEINLDLKEKSFIKFNKLHPQVKFIKY